jgi:hypothetical protein
MPETHPRLRAVALDTTDARGLAEFYRRLLGFAYRPGDEPPGPGEPDTKAADWLVLLDASGEPRLAFQHVDEMPRATWPDPTIPQQLHLDLTVSSAEELSEQRDRAVALGATVLEDRCDDPQEALYVFADPAGHPFCIFVSPS